MPRKPIACPSCGALVSNGRLSCPACGTLVASVSGAPKPAAEAVARPRPAARRAGAPHASPDSASPVETASTPAAQPAARRVQTVESEREHPGSILRQLETRPPAWHTTPVAADLAAAPQPAIPGAYLAPSAAFTAPLLRPRPDRPNEPLAVPPPAAPSGYATSATATALPVAFAPSFNPPAAVADAASPVGKRTGLSLEAPVELPGWLAIAGSAIAAVSFLMPWSRDGVIGAVGSAYFDRWGLANVGYLPLVLAALALLVVNGIPNPIPSWIRAGLASLTVGAILFGLDWAYQTRPYSDGLGVTLLLVGSLVLIVGGLVGVRSGRHPAVPPVV